MNGHIAPGEVLEGIPARHWNSFVDAAKTVRDWQSSLQQRSLSFAGDTSTILVRNDSGGDLDRYAIVVPSGIVFTPTDSQQSFESKPCLTVDAPATADMGRFLVMTEPLAEDKIGRAQILGVTACKIDVVHADDDFADVINGDTTKLQSGPYGPAHILYKESGTGTKWAIVALGVAGMQLVLGKTAASHAKGASGTINVYRGVTAGSEANTSSKTITAWNHFADLGSAKWVICGGLMRNWKLIAGEC